MLRLSYAPISTSSSIGKSFLYSEVLPYVSVVCVLLLRRKPLPSSPDVPSQVGQTPITLKKVFPICIVLPIGLAWRWEEIKQLRFNGMSTVDSLGLR